MRIGRANRSVIGLCLLLLAGMAGCAHEQAYDRGMEFARQAQYDRAISELENAIRLAEEQHRSDEAARYHASLADVKRAAGQFHYRQAQNQFDAADLASARASIDRGIGYQPQESAYPALRERIAGGPRSSTTAFSTASATTGCPGT